MSTGVLRGARDTSCRPGLYLAGEEVCVKVIRVGVLGLGALWPVGSGQVKGLGETVAKGMAEARTQIGIRVEVRLKLEAGPGQLGKEGEGFARTSRKKGCHVS